MQTAASSGTTTRVTVPWVALSATCVLLSPGLAPPSAASGVGMMVALVIATMLAILMALDRRPIVRQAAPVIAATLGLVAPAVGSVFSISQRASILGLIGQHLGAATWLAAGAWLIAALVAGTRADLRWLVRFVSVIGAAYAVLATLQTIGLLPERYEGRGAGEAVFASSLVLAQFLVLAAGCAVAWALGSRTGRERGVALACAGACLVGVVASEASMPWFGLGAGAIAYLALSRGSSDRRRPVMFATAAGSAALAFLGVTAAVSVGALGEGAFAAGNRVLNQRFEIWQSAWARIAVSPIRPHGLDQFSAWASWGPASAGGIQAQAAYDPHSVPLAALHGGGLLGGLAMFAGAFVLLTLLVTTHDHQNGPHPERALIAALVGYATTLTVSWAAAVPFVLATCLTGLVLATGPRADTGTGRRLRWVSAVCVALVTGALSVYGFRFVATEYTWASAAGDSGMPSVAVSLSALDTWPTATYAYAVLTRVKTEAAQGDAASLRIAQHAIDLGLEHERYYVDLALEDATLAGAIETDVEAAWERFSAAIERGRIADPASGLWDYISAETAAQWGLSDQAREHALAALANPDTPPAARAHLEALTR